VNTLVELRSAIYLMLTNETAGSLLKRQRVKNKQSIADLCASSLVAEESFLALESDNLAHFKTMIGAEGIAKKYAKFVGLDDEFIASLVRRDYVVTIKDEETSLSQKYGNSNKQTNFDVWWYSGFIVIFISLSFFSYQLYLFFLPPKIQIIEPRQFDFRRLERVRVTIQSSPESEVYINKNRATKDESDNYYFDIDLKRGKNEIKIEAVGANGKTSMKTLTLQNN
jgi:cytoskeletal protein RodZ